MEESPYRTAYHGPQANRGQGEAVLSCSMHLESDAQHFRWPAFGCKSQTTERKMVEETMHSYDHTGRCPDVGVPQWTHSVQNKTFKSPGLLLRFIRFSSEDWKLAFPVGKFQIRYLTKRWLYK